MKRLILLRHAKASAAADAVADFERPLAPRGRRAAQAIGEWLRQEGHIPDLVLCSPAQRTKETWELLSLMLKAPPPVRFHNKLYLADEDDLLRRLHRLSSEVDCALLVGHNPGLENLAVGLYRDGQPEAFARLKTKYPTGAIAVFAFEIEDWAELERRRGKLEEFVRPRDLD
jgi:phosphohistidine phosphatase